MKNKAVLVAILLNLLNVNQSLSLNYKTKKLIPLVPLNILAGVFVKYLFNSAKNQYITADLISEDPKTNILSLQKYCNNYKKSVTLYSLGKTSYGKMADHSLALKLIDVNDDANKLNNFALFVSTLMKKDADEKYAIGFLVTLLSILGSLTYIYEN